MSYVKKQVARVRVGESKAIVFGTGKAANDAFGLMIPTELGGGAHVPVEVDDDRGYVRASAICAIEEFTDEYREGTCFGVKRDKEGGFTWTEVWRPWDCRPGGKRTYRSRRGYR